MVQRVAKTRRPISLMEMVDHRFVRSDGTAIPFKHVLRDYVSTDEISGDPIFQRDAGIFSQVYLLLEEQASRQDVDFYDVLLSKLRGDNDRYRRIRYILIRNREIEPKEDDCRDMVSVLSGAKYGDFWTIAKALDLDPRRIADATYLLYPHLIIDSDAAYHIVTKLVTGRVQLTRTDSTADPLADLKEFARKIEPDLLLREKALFRLCVDGAEEKYLPLFSRDPQSAFASLESSLSSEQNESVKLILDAVLQNYRKINSLEVAGSVDHLVDKETAEVLVFPSIYQKAGIQRILEDKRILIADEMGVGKTAQAILSFVELCNREPGRRHKSLIICPSSLVEHWRTEVSKYLTPECAERFKSVAIQSHNKTSALEEARDARIVIISYDMIIRTFNGQRFDDVRAVSNDSDAMAFTPAEASQIVDELSSMGFTHVTIDEVHRAKNPNYASRAAVVASTYLKENVGRGKDRSRILITCAEDDIESWEMEMSAICRHDNQPPTIVSVTNGSLDGVSNADVVIAPKNMVETILKTEKFDKIYDESNIPEYTACQRSATVHKLVSSPERGGAEYLVLLTGTPLPNRISDIGNMAAMLEPENYPNAAFFNEQSARPNNEKIIRELLLRRMIRRRVHQVMDLEPYELETMDLTLPHSQRKVYQLVQDNTFDSTANRKLLWTRMASLNPHLLADSIDVVKLRRVLKLKPRQVQELSELKALAAQAPSVKFEALTRLVVDEVAAGRKVLIFSSILREGIIDPLVLILRSAGVKTEYIDGRVTTGVGGGEREQIRLAFQSTDGPDVLVAMLKTMADGVSLTAASTVIYLDYPYNDTDVKQGIGRSWRRGQHKKVRVIFMKALDTLDENGEELIREKERIAKMLIDGTLPSEEERHIYETRKAEKTRPFVGALKTPQQLLSEHYARMHGRGARQNRVYLFGEHNEEKNARSFASLYLFKWEASYHANTARVVRTLVEALERRRGQRFERIVDLGSGPAIVTRITGRPTTCVDMNPYMLARAREDFGDMVETHEALLDDLPLENESFDLAVMSLALHYSQPLPDNGDPRGERERILREAARILRRGAPLILTEVPTFVNSDGIDLLCDGMSQLGFDRSSGLVGYALDSHGDASFRSFVLTMNKSSEVIANPAPDSFVLSTEYNIRNLRGRRSKKKVPNKTQESKKLESFVFIDLNGTHLLLEDLFRPVGVPEESEPERRTLIAEPKSKSNGADVYQDAVSTEDQRAKHERLIDRRLDELAELEIFGAREQAYDLLDRLVDFDDVTRTELAKATKIPPVSNPLDTTSSCEEKTG